jgi:hypothetical protein
MTLRIVRTSAEVLGVPAVGDVRVARLLAEVAGQPDPDLRLYRFVQQVLVQRPDAITKTVEQTLDFSQSAGLGGSTYNRAVAQSLVFGQTAVKVVTLEPTVAQSLVFGHVLPVPGQSKPGIAASSLVFGQTADKSLNDESVVHSLIFTGSGETTQPNPIEKTVVDGLVFDHVLTAYDFQPIINQSLIFTHNATGSGIIPGGLERSAEDELIFTHTVQKVLIKVGATDHDATHSLVFTHKAALPLLFLLQDGLIFDGAAAASYIWNLEQEFTFSHTESVAGSVWDRTLTSGLVFTHAFVFDSDNVSLCTYAPLVGENSIPEAVQPPSATAPTLVPQDTITLFYPTVTPTSSVEIRAPELGDRDRLEMLRINRESRGGTLQVFADLTWPKVQVLALQFTGLTEAEAASVQAFFASTLGLEVGLTDWEGRTWHGIVVTPNEPLIRSRRGIVDISFEFDGELQ